MTTSFIFLEIKVKILVMKRDVYFSIPIIHFKQHIKIYRKEEIINSHTESSQLKSIDSTTYFKEFSQLKV